MKKREFLFIVDRNQIDPELKNNMEFLTKLKIHIYFDPENELTGIYPIVDTHTYVKYYINNYIHCIVICNKKFFRKV